MATKSQIQNFWLLWQMGQSISWFNGTLKRVNFSFTLSIKPKRLTSSKQISVLRGLIKFFSTGNKIQLLWWVREIWSFLKFQLIKSNWKIHPLPEDKLTRRISISHHIVSWRMVWSLVLIMDNYCILLSMANSSRFFIQVQERITLLKHYSIYLTAIRHSWQAARMDF